MSDRPPSPRAHTAGAAAAERGPHHERLVVPWWWWPMVMAVAALLAAEVHMGYPGVRAWLPYVVILPVAALVLLRLGNRQVEVDGEGEDAEIRVDGARLAVRHVGRTDVVAGQAKQHALGPELDPTAFVLHRPWVRAAVRVENRDPDDAVPYWVVSSRHPERLVAAIDARRAR